MRKMRSRVSCLSAAVAAVMFGGVSARAQSRDLTWDLNNGATTPSGNNGSENWDESNPNWVFNGVRTTWSNANPDNAFFGNTNTAFVGGALTNVINVNSPITVNNITLGTGSNGGSYHIFMFGSSGGSNITLGGNLTRPAPGGQLQVIGDLPLVLRPATTSSPSMTPPATSRNSCSTPASRAVAA